MARKYIRKITRTGTHSYSINIPKEIMRLFSWKERQKLVIKISPRTKKINITDYNGK